MFVEKKHRFVRISLFSRAILKWFCHDSYKFKENNVKIDYCTLKIMKDEDWMRIDWWEKCAWMCDCGCFVWKSPVQMT